MIVAGLISGTSADALDIAVTELELDGADLTMRVLAHEEAPFPEGLRSSILDLLELPSVQLSLVCQVDTEFGRFAAASLADVLSAGALSCDLVVTHGQTVYHWVDAGSARGTLQIGQPAWIAAATGAPVLSDVRASDIAAGGQGAPLASTLDALLLADVESPTVALNLGGIANITVVAPGADPLAYDTGPANALIDLMARRISGDAHGFDRDGALAASGSVAPDLLDTLLADPYYRLPAPKSTGKEYFNRDYLDRALARHSDVPAADVMATLTELTARTVADACHRHGATSVFASGGGTRNAFQMKRLAAVLGAGTSLSTTDVLGLPSAIKEACLMALVGWLSWHGLPATLPSCTGAAHGSVAGRFTPGSRPLLLPSPIDVRPTRLHVTS